MIIEELMNKLESSFWTKKEFDGFLEQYADYAGIQNIYIEVVRHNRVQCTYGKKPEQKPPVVRCFSVPHILSIQCSIWSKQHIDMQVEKDISRMIVSFLGNISVLDATQIPLYEKTAEDGNRSKCEGTVQRFIREGKPVAIFMLDLDHFKRVNEKYNHDVGSAVLSEFSDLLVKKCEDSAIVVHRSGDEFFIIMPYNIETEIFDLAYSIREEAKNHQYNGVEGIKLTTAQGVCLVSDNRTSFQQAVVMAENAYSSNLNKCRNTIRIINASEIYESGRGIINRDLAFVLVKCGVNSDCIFFNPYLDFISTFVSRIRNVDDIQKLTEDVIKWISPSSADGMQMLNFPQKINYTCEWSEDEIAFALFHGLCKNRSLYHGGKLCLEFNETENNFCISLNETRLFTSKIAKKLLGSQFYQMKLPQHETGEIQAKTVVMIQIGYDESPVPESCFYHVIKIDARSTIGGNLPDFWEGALAELIDVLASKPCHVVVYGKREHGRLISTVLEEYKNWGKDEYPFSFLAKKTMQPIDKIEHCKKCLESYLRFVENGKKEQLIDVLKDICLNVPSLPSPLVNPNPTQRHFLDRSLAFEPIKLRIADGCRVKTLDEAFPTVLEIIRNFKLNEIQNEIKDQSGRRLKELPNFKIVITNPSSNDIPDYNQTDIDRRELEKYYESNFGREDGFFQKYLIEDGQYHAVLRHISNIIKEDGLVYATRRAILTIPHIVNQGDLSPLGLISIIISPRSVNDGIDFNFSFTWRTVEALVGLPYSLYGSIRYAEQILKTISENVIEQIPGIRLSMGSLSYIACSLHMFLDDSRSQIVRGIINDASK